MTACTKKLTVRLNLGNFWYYLIHSLWSSLLFTKQDKQRTYKPNIEARSRNHCCREKAKIITYSEYVFVAVVIMQCACAVSSYVACPAVPQFSTLFHKRNDFNKKKFEHKMCFDFLYNFYLNISHSKNNSARYHKCVVVDVKYPLFLSGFIGT